MSVGPEVGLSVAASTLRILGFCAVKAAKGAARPTCHRGRTPVVTGKDRYRRQDLADRSGTQVHCTRQPTQPGGGISQPEPKE